MPSAWELRITRLDTWSSEDPGRTFPKRSETWETWHGYAWLRFLDDYLFQFIFVMLSSPKISSMGLYRDLGVKKSTLELRLGTRRRSRYQVATDHLGCLRLAEADP